LKWEDIDFIKGLANVLRSVVWMVQSGVARRKYRNNQCLWISLQPLEER
jgi:hypothetical protein